MSETMKAYRVPDRPADNERELVYTPRDPEHRVAAQRAALQGFAGAVLVGGVLIAWDLTLVSALAIGGALAWGIWRSRRSRDVRGLVLRVVDRELEVGVRGSATPILHVHLADLRDVVLDTRSIRRVVPDTSALPSLGWLQSRVGPEVNAARIVLVPAGDEPVRLTDAFLAHIESVEWLGRIRTFLRRHGWKPKDELEPESDPPFE